MEENEQTRKPPLGVMPVKIWKEKRLSELLRAMYEYDKAGFMFSTDWINEALALKTELDKEWELNNMSQAVKQFCYKSGKVCPYDCSGLCKDSC